MMIETLLHIGIGCFIGFLIGLQIASLLHIAELEYKAKTGIDMSLRGKFYTIKRNYEREKNNK